MRKKVVLCFILLVCYYCSTIVTSSSSLLSSNYSSSSANNQTSDNPQSVTDNRGYSGLVFDSMENITETKYPRKRTISVQSVKRPVPKVYVKGQRLINQKHRVLTVNCKCRKHDFNVNFYDLGWGKWIIYPKVFNAHRCEGDCSLPSMGNYVGRQAQQQSSSRSSTSVVKMTNHAQIMSILELKHPELSSQQMSKCVSTRLKPLTVIFLDERGQIKTKQYRDMIVEECGCR